MFRELKKIEKGKIEEYIQMYADIQYLQSRIRDIETGVALPTKQFNFWERHVSKRQEYKENQKMIKRIERRNKESCEALQKEIKRMEDALKKESMRRFRPI